MSCPTGRGPGSRRQSLTGDLREFMRLEVLNLWVVSLGSYTEKGLSGSLPDHSSSTPLPLDQRTDNMTRTERVSRRRYGNGRVVVVGEKDV